MDDKKNLENNLDKYGEVIPTEFTWITPQEQQKKAEELEHLSDKNSSS